MKESVHMKQCDNRIYLDHAATTPVRKEVLQAMLPFFQESFGNPMGLYQEGQLTRNAVEAARGKLAGLIGARKEEICFTGSGTEADNWALIKGAASRREKGRHIVATAVEHHAVLEPCRYLEKQGYDITYIQPDQTGRIRAEQVLDAVRDDTCLVSCMMANNETGAIMPIDEIGRRLKETDILFHVDAVQALGKIPIDLSRTQVDLMSFSAHKIGGPKGTGALYINSRASVAPFLLGGQQERGRRAGTENVPGIVGFGEACAIAQAHLAEQNNHLRKLRALFVSELNHQLDGVSFHGAGADPGESYLPGIVNAAFHGVQAESLMILLDMQGIAVSAGSACMSGAGLPSHVLAAMGLDRTEIDASIRFSFGYENTEEEIVRAVSVLSECTKRLRSLA